MKRALLLTLTLLATGTLAIPGAAQDMSPQVRIISPYEGETFPAATIQRRTLQWNDERKEMYALVTFSTRRYAGQTERAEEETIRFYLPGLQYDKGDGVYFVSGRDGERIPFARDKKTLFVKSIEPVDNAVVRVRRNKGNVKVFADIYPSAEVIAREQARIAAYGTNDTHSVDLEGLPGGAKLPANLLGGQKNGQGTPQHPHERRFGVQE